MKDFSTWEVYEGIAEGSGRSEKIWLQNPQTGKLGLFKFKKDSYTTDHISECIAYKIAELLAIPCARFELGKYNGREGSISYNIVEEGQILVEGINYINLVYPYYDPEKCIDIESGDVYSLEMIEKSVQGIVDFSEFLKIPIFDFLIGNTDRHQSNWAIIQSNRDKKIAPLYDNSSSLCAYISDDKLKEYLGKDMVRWKSLVDTKSKSMIRRLSSEKRRPTHLEVVRYLRENYYEETVDFVNKISLLMTDDNITGILNEYINEGLSDIRKQVLKRFLMDKTSIIEELYFK